MYDCFNNVKYIVIIQVNICCTTIEKYVYYNLARRGVEEGEEKEVEERASEGGSVTEAEDDDDELTLLL